MASSNLVFLLLAATCAIGLVSAKLHEPDDDNRLDEAEHTGSVTTSLDQKASKSPKGDVSISVKGSAKWEEKITMSKKHGGKIWGDHHGHDQHGYQDEHHDHHHHHHHHPHPPPPPPHFQPFFEPICCVAPANFSDMTNITAAFKKCKSVITQLIKKPDGEDKRPRPRHEDFLKGVNCFLQCIGTELGLSENGVLYTQEVVDFLQTDNTLSEMGINGEDIQACIITSKHNTS
ncbi:hypothetical protein L9F63_025426, partial [Diploptera punctata]